MWRLAFEGRPRAGHCMARAAQATALAGVTRLQASQQTRVGVMPRGSSKTQASTRKATLRIDDAPAAVL